MIEYSYANAPLQKELLAGEKLQDYPSVALVFFSLEVSNVLILVWGNGTDEVGNTAAFLVSPLASAITGSVVYVDNGLNTMGLATDSPTLAV